MGLVWTVPVVAAAVAAALLAARARALEEAGRGLADEVARLHELRHSLAGLRASARAIDGRVEEFRARHPLAPLPGDGAPEG